MGESNTSPPPIFKKPSAFHEGLRLEGAKNRLEKEIGNVTSTEIAKIEQGLMKEGIAPDEIKKFCNVHALIFQSALEKSMDKEQSPDPP